MILVAIVLVALVLFFVKILTANESSLQPEVESSLTQELSPTLEGILSEKITLITTLAQNGRLVEILEDSKKKNMC